MKLELEKLCFSYDKGGEVLHDVSFSMASGDIVCILGPNGSGKTTLLDCIMSLNAPSSGYVMLDGETTASMTPREVARHVGYVPQSIVPSFDYTVIDYVVTGCAPHLKMLERPGSREYKIAADALECVGILHLKDASYARISGGERQQVSIARVLAQRPDIILLDEPTSHLDYGNQVRVLSMVERMAAEGYGILMTTHNPNHVLMLGGSVAIIDQDGGFAFGSAEDMITEQLLCSLYHTELHLIDSALVQRRVCVAPKLR